MPTTSQSDERRVLITHAKLPCYLLQSDQGGYIEQLLSYTERLLSYTEQLLSYTK